MTGARRGRDYFEVNINHGPERGQDDIEAAARAAAELDWKCAHVAFSLPASLPAPPPTYGPTPFLLSPPYAGYFNSNCNDTTI